MGDHVYKVVEIGGSFTQSSDDAIRAGLTRTAHCVRGISWFEGARAAATSMTGRSNISTEYD